MSAGPNIHEDRKSNQQWDTLSVPITLQQNNWGISTELNEPIIQLLESLGLYTDVSGNRVFTINVLKVLVKYIHQQKMDMPNFVTAIGKLMTDHQQQLTAETVRVLITFFSNFPGPKGQTAFNGVWNEASKILLEKVAGDYQLAAQSPSPKLLQQLRTISKRVLRANLMEKMSSDIIEGNSFFVFDPDERKWTLAYNSEDDSSLYLTDTTENKQLVRIDWRRQRKDGSRSNSFERFSKWMMLLMMTGKGIHYDYVNLMIEKEGQPPASIEDYYDPEHGGDFLVKVDYQLDFPNQHQTIPLLFNPKDGYKVNVIAVLFSENFNAAITQGYRTGEPTKDGTKALIDFEYFFIAADPEEPIQCLQKANFLKLFVVRDSFGRGTNQNDNIENPFNIGPSDITALLSADDKDILATVTIGLNFQGKPSFDSNANA